MTINPPKFIKLRRDVVKHSKVLTIKWKGLWMRLSSNLETFHTKGSLSHQCIPTDDNEETTTMSQCIPEKPEVSGLIG